MIKRRYGEENPGTLCFRKTSFVHTRSGNYFALLLGYFCLKFLPDVRYCVCWVLAEIWAPNSSHKIGNKYFIHHFQGWKEGSFVCETVWFFCGWILIRLSWNFSRFFPNSVEILTWNFRKKVFQEDFSEILCKPRLSLYQNLWNFAQISALLFQVRIALKKFTQVLPYVVCTQIRRHIHKQMTKKKDTGKKIQDTLFSENQFCSLSVWDLLRLTPWVFLSEIFTRRSSPCLLSFGWDLRFRFVPQDWK